jgi:hypothetical protein
MSEPNSPFEPQAEPELESSLNWWNPFPELTDSELAKTEETSEQPDEQSLELTESASQKVPEAVPVNLCVAPVVVSPSSGVSPTIDHKASASEVSGDGEAANPLTAALPDQVSQSSEPPNLIDLISLIQELNQCNGVLLDRVSQLEDALERSQQALKGQVERSPDAWTAPQSEDLATAQAQIANLFSQLEFAHQTNQRQHIVIETLTAELESSQERVAQLEREAALLQQRYNEQMQLLVQSEGTCRDLQARLQRQQRYTLQFKAALEKCLEMPMPQPDSGTEMVAPPVDSLLLPKAQQIQPWSKAAVSQESLLPWMKRFKAADEAVSHDAEQAEQTASEVRELLSEVHPAAEVTAIEEPVRSKPVQLPVLAPLDSTTSTPPGNSSDNLSEQQEMIDPALATSHSQTPEPIASHPNEIAPEPPASISYSLKGQSGIVPPPALLNQLDAVVPPLADRLTEALLSQAIAEEADAETAQPPQNTAPEIVLAEFSAEAVEADNVIVSDPDQLLASALSEAEDALWQDLARLMEGSPEEAVKASLTGDLAAFASLNFDEPEQSAAAATPEPPISEPIMLEPEIRVQIEAAEPHAPTPPAPKVTMPVLTQNPTQNPNSPSPLLHPFHPAKAKRSLSSVELPSFLRQEDSKPLPT